MKKVTLIIGDGIGPEIVESVKRVFKAADVQIEWEETNAGIAVMEQYGTPLLDSIKKNKVALKAPLTTPIGEGFRSVNVALRKELDLYANVRPIISLEGVKSKYENIDLVIVRENTEDIYMGIEHMVTDDAAESIKIITRKGSERIARFAFDILEARSSSFKHSKANKIGNQYKKAYSSVQDITIDDRIIDNMCMQLVQRPETFDIILAPNLYGDILSDLCAGLVGGLGVAPGANIGDEYSVYEAIHGTAPDIAGQNKANPTSLLLSAVMMLRDKNIEDFKNADRIEKAIKKTLKEGLYVTGDLGGTATTSQFTNAVIANLE
jgi:isocitrate dehydrogenase (NAD+)